LHSLRNKFKQKRLRLESEVIIDMKAKYGYAKKRMIDEHMSVKEVKKVPNAKYLEGAILLK